MDNKRLFPIAVVLSSFVLALLGLNILNTSFTKVDEVNYVTTYSAPYVSKCGEYEPSDINCPIPMTDRVPNYTGIQCVYSSIEMLGRWAEEPKLINPPITSRSDCKGYSSPNRAADRLRKVDVKFKQTYGDREAGIKLLKKAMEEGRGCLFGVPGHAMVIVHYDEEEDRVCWVDNSDSSLKVQTMTIARFKKRWDSWILVIYADNDIIPSKIKIIRFSPHTLPIIDHNTNPTSEYPKNFIPIPRTRF